MKAPLRVEQAMLAALEHSITHPTITWHDIGTDITVRNAIERLVKRGAVEINAETNRYRLKEK
jgi:hypothetical protein